MELKLESFSFSPLCSLYENLNIDIDLANEFGWFLEFALLCKMSAETTMTDSDVNMQANLADLPTSTSDSSMLNLEHNGLASLNQHMNKYSKIFDFYSDTIDWNDLLQSVLLYLTAKLASSSIKSKVIGPSNVEEKVNNFNEEHLKMWKEVTQVIGLISSILVCAFWTVL
jgi:hypothetical protein